ncbi:MAG: DUF58 domain-containing protein [Oscillospiraceae bacterium]|nr:DUF58 domain-containing protein [Oscillospiraceae bacterium]
MLKSRIIFFFALVGAAMLAIGYSDTRAGFTILYSLLILLAFCALSVILAPGVLKVEEKMAASIAFKGEPVSYTLTIHNRGPLLYPGVACHFHNAGLMTMEGSLFGGCQPFRGHSREFVVSFPYRGIYTVGLEKITVTDMFGLFTRTIGGGNALTLTVYPEREDGFALSLRNDPQDASFHQDIFNEDYSTIADLRKYTPADSLRKIHWKLSAKRGELIAKNFQSFEPDKTILLLDTLKIDLPARPKAELEDKMVAYIASSIEFCARSKIPTSLIYGQPGLDETTIDPNGEVDSFYPLLAGLNFDRAVSCVHLVSRLPGGYSLIAYLSKIDDEIAAALKEAVSFDHKLIIYLFSSATQPENPQQTYLLESLRTLGVSVNLVVAGKPDTAAHSPDEEGGAA